MATADYGTTKFEYDPDFSGKVKIFTSEGSVVAVSADDILKFVYYAYVLPKRAAKAERVKHIDGLLGG